MHRSAVRLLTPHRIPTCPLFPTLQRHLTSVNIRINTKTISRQASTTTSSTCPSSSPSQPRPRLALVRDGKRAFATAAETASEDAADDSKRVEVFLLPRAFLVTTQTIPGYEIAEVIGFVSGNTVRVRNIVRDWFAGVRAVFGGELATYTDLMMEAREEATERMIAEAVELGANAIVNIRVETSNLAANASEIYCYGTAVVVTAARGREATGVVGGVEEVI